jgi:ABC-type multidrug transport system fused ATPase/permease subunit
MTLPTAFLVFMYTQQMMGPLDRMAFQAQDFQAASACIIRLQELLAMPRPSMPVEPLAPPSGLLSLKVQDLTFTYGEGPEVLSHVSVDVAAGEVLGIVGRTGCGKSTLARLIARLHEPNSGRILLGGVDMACLSHADVLDRIAFVPQEVQLFHASLRDNVTLFSSDVSDDAVIACFGRLGLLGWLERLPQRLDTVLLAGGLTPSAGEAQMIALTRVLLRDPQLVILDEASARLDPITEQALDNAVGQLLEGRTAVIIAHRLATLRRVTHIAVMDDGQVVEHGTPSVLSADSTSRFAALLAAAEGAGA